MYRVGDRKNLCDFAMELKRGAKDKLVSNTNVKKKKKSIETWNCDYDLVSDLEDKKC